MHRSGEKAYVRLIIGESDCHYSPPRTMEMGVYKPVIPGTFVGSVLSTFPSITVVTIRDKKSLADGSSMHKLSSSEKK